MLLKISETVEIKNCWDSPMSSNYIDVFLKKHIVTVCPVKKCGVISYITNKGYNCLVQSYP